MKVAATPGTTALTLPHDLEAEASVLGAILLDQSAAVEVMDFLRPEDFYRENNGTVFRAALQLLRAGEPIDNVTLASELERLGVLARMGGRAHLALLQELVPTAANAEHYARIVKRHSLRRRLIAACADGYRLGFDMSLEAEEALDRAGQQVLAVGDDSAVRARDMEELLVDALDRLLQRRDSGRRLTGLGSGLHDLDRLTGGWQPGDLVVIAGRPSTGKTALALQAAVTAAQQQVPVAVFSLEMRAELLLDRLLCNLAEIDTHRFRDAVLGEAEESRLSRAMGVLGSLKIVIDDRASLDELSLVAQARRLRQLEHVGLFVVDYLQLVRAPGRGGDDNRVQEVSAVTRTLKRLARDLGVPVIALSQLSRAPELRADKRPQLSDLRESGEIEQTADVVIMLRRPDDAPDVSDLIVAKHRNGATGTVRVGWRATCVRFQSLARQEVGSAGPE
jgi:replicative DNA helicase